MMREGLIPTLLGAAVTAAGTAFEVNDMKKRNMKAENVQTAPLIAAGIIGFGLAHVVLGAIDLVEHRR